MVLKIIMLLILIYPLIAAIGLCKRVWNNDPSSFVALTLLKFFPLNVARAVSFLFPLAVLVLATLVAIMVPV